ncbi:DUF1822 family protein [Calothrix rhizosoleniae]|uniref:DUF1822 family protein n=1 Tax=Calothrix rhizosoleniae TaxID=888997 RepID=UPI000B4A400C|nr:DUF1822 family protein [Calothrix rhizosoleniae]
MNTQIGLTDLRYLQPESIWLEPEQVEQAKKISQAGKDEAQQWQSYLNALALIGFEKWLRKRKPESTVVRNFNSIGDGYHLGVDGFNIYLLVTEHLLDEVVRVSQDAIDSPERVAHFYVILEVSEEQQYVIVRGFLRYDELANYLQRSNCHPSADGCYAVPLSEFDAEPNHLLFYTHYLEPSAIISSFASKGVAEKNKEDLLTHLTETRVKLSQWLQGVFQEGWQTIDLMLSPEAELGMGLRGPLEIKAGKLINLGMQLGNRSLALLLTVTKDAEAEEKVRVQVQLHPTGEEKYLPSNLQLKLLSKAGKSLQEVESRDQDNYIQLNSFRGEPGKRFSVEVGLGDVSVREDFEF